MKRNACSPEKESSRRWPRPQEKAWRKKFGLSTTFALPLDIAPSWQATLWPSFLKYLPLRERMRERSARSLEQIAAGGCCARDSSLLRLGNVGRGHGVETADSG